MVLQQTAVVEYKTSQRSWWISSYALMVFVHLLGAPDVASAAANTALPPKTSATYDYSEALHKTLIFFESMRSGVLDRQRLAW